MQRTTYLARSFLTLLLVLATILVGHFWASGQLPQVQSVKLLGSFVGIAFGLLHVPLGRHVAPPPDWQRRALAFTMSFVTGFTLAAPWLLVQKPPTNKEWANVIALGLMSPIAIHCVVKSHPPSGYVRDAVWSVAGLWFVLVQLDLLHTVKNVSTSYGRQS